MSVVTIIMVIIINIDSVINIIVTTIRFKLRGAGRGGAGRGGAGCGLRAIYVATFAVQADCGPSYCGAGCVLRAMI